MLAHPRRHRYRQLLGHREQQRVRGQVGVVNVGGRELVTKDVDELATEQGLTRAHLADDLDETLAAAQRDQQNVQSILVAGPV